jgi:uncharacterized delta-60 repeat protein
MKKVLLLPAVFVFFALSSTAQQPGTVDSGFGNGGKVLQNDLYDAYTSVCIQSDGKIIAAQQDYVIPYTNRVGNLVRYNTDGSLDSAFGNHGKLSVKVPVYNDQLTGFFQFAGLQPDGRIIGLGITYEYIFNGPYIIFTARFLSSGILDSSYGTNGITTYENGDFSTLQDFAIQPDGKILLSVNVIYDAVPSIEIPTLLRYNKDGSADNSFGIDGIVSSNVMKNRSIALQDNGKIILGGVNYVEAAFLLNRRMQNGEPDLSFGNAGFATLPFFSEPWLNRYAVLYDIAVQKDNKIVAAGRIQDNEFYSSIDFAVGRIDANGKIDSSFADNGIIKPRFKKSAYNEAEKILLQPDGKIIIGGISRFFGLDIPDSSVLTRLRKNGRLDRTFGTNGITKMPALSGFQIYDAILQPDGKIVTCGSAVSGYDSLHERIEMPSLVRYYGGDCIPKTKDADTIAVNDFNNAITLNNKVSVYPNPAKDMVHIQTKGKVDITLTDQSGKTILTKFINGQAEINISYLPAGLYYIKNMETGVVKQLMIIR